MIFQLMIYFITIAWLFILFHWYSELLIVRAFIVLRSKNLNYLQSYNANINIIESFRVSQARERPTTILSFSLPSQIPNIELSSVK